MGGEQLPEIKDEDLFSRDEYEDLFIGLSK